MIDIIYSAMKADFGEFLLPEFQSRIAPSLDAWNLKREFMRLCREYGPFLNRLLRVT
ncbi:hypothetical protein [Stenotrophomonas sp.]|uniref:hypothetical protein n=1 Tax=Stenotrophomonas sp. TaxID=69392 RepID=UPI002898780B|nr:hypothetical protein [Stenotrophomonas sp.]